MCYKDPLYCPGCKRTRLALRVCTAFYLNHEGTTADPNHVVVVKPTVLQKWCWFCLDDIREAAEQAELESQLNNMDLGQRQEEALERKVDDVSEMFGAIGMQQEERK